MVDPEMPRLFAVLADHERMARRSFSLIPSENALSPLARAAFLSDAFSRYFFNEHEVFGRWSFQGGSIAGRVQTEIVAPLARKLGGAAFVNLHPISGLTAMTLVQMAFGGDPGSVMISIDVEHGGHPDTAYVAAKLGFRVEYLPFTDWRTVDLAGLAELVERSRPALLYLDHATVLHPLDYAAICATVRAVESERVHVHVDTSHVNGLIWGEVLANPLRQGADSYGGSTHKTFPGPHKGLIFTDSAELDERLTLTAVNMISHHHLSSVIALGIALVEFAECDGRGYAAQVVDNARTFAGRLAASGTTLGGGDAGWTRTHQVWAAAPPGESAYALADRLFAAGLIVNPYNPLPSFGGPGIRTGLNEVTRLGLARDGVVVLADAYSSVADDPSSVPDVARTVAELRAETRPRYCYDAASAEVVLTPFLDVLEDDRARLYRPRRSPT